MNVCRDHTPNDCRDFKFEWHGVLLSHTNWWACSHTCHGVYIDIPKSLEQHQLIKWAQWNSKSKILYMMAKLTCITMHTQTGVGVYLFPKRWKCECCIKGVVHSKGCLIIEMYVLITHWFNSCPRAFFHDCMISARSHKARLNWNTSQEIKTAKWA